MDTTIRPDNVTDLASARHARASAAATRTEPRKKNRRFDKEKVERLKAEIEAGAYEVDPVRVANKFIEHDKNQTGR